MKSTYFKKFIPFFLFGLLLLGANLPAQAHFTASSQFYWQNLGLSLAYNPAFYRYGYYPLSFGYASWNNLNGRHYKPIEYPNYRMLNHLTQMGEAKKRAWLEQQFMKQPQLSPAPIPDLMAPEIYEETIKE